LPSRAGRDDLAGAALDAAIRLEREPFDGRLDLALLRARKGDLDGALALCEEARSGRSFLARGEVVVARLLPVKGDLAAAREKLEHSNAVRVGQAEALELLANIVEAPQNREESRLGRLFDALMSGPKRREEAARQEAASFREAGARARAARTPWPPSSPIEEGDCEPPTSEDLARAAAIDAASPGFRAALALDPGCSEAAFHVAQQLDWDGKGARAKVFCERVLAVNPRAERVWRFLADLRCRNDDFASARESLLRALDCATDRFEPLLALARLDLRTKEFAAAGAARILRWLTRYPLSGRTDTVRLLFRVQAEEADWAALLDSASEALAAGWPEFEEAFRLRRRALEALRKTTSVSRAES
jgi:hypothetical protein